MRKHLRFVLLSSLILFFTYHRQAYAHGFGERYDLPLPLWLYLVGSGAAVLLSFVMIASLFHRLPKSGAYTKLDLLTLPFGRMIMHPFLLMPIKLGSVLIFFLVILSGLLGDSIPAKNFAPTLIWIIWWVGIAYICALIGNVWSLINPWKIIYEWIEWVGHKCRLGIGFNPPIKYPISWGYWPAVLLFLTFSWIELVYDFNVVPVRLAQFILMYSAITWSGMLLFGKSVWLQYGEVFSVIFSLLARFSPTESRVLDADVCAVCPITCLDQEGNCLECDSCLGRVTSEKRQLNVRAYGVGLLQGVPVESSLTVLIITLLATVTFDGFTATSVWNGSYLYWYSKVPMPNLIETLGLISFPILFGSVFLLICWLTSILINRSLTSGLLARYFVLSLIPIALAYHLAHYFSFLLIQGQLIVPLMSDPFGFGWDLLGTSNYKSNISVVGARFTWYLSVVAIVIGHIAAVFLAHVTFLGMGKQVSQTFRIQIPMLALMIVYTMLSLWILAQPIVETTI
ncbi:hypothetical protein FIM02_01725 [SAR202 cluster bacterium AD-802-E10_MRT_200m]|nr:hypothetical protein [SAR202 cluster bacterium AD-802-E10_MRT_200m]